MNTRSLTREERFELIMECRSSGLPDYQWCQNNGIKPSTFYNWISKFRRDGYPNIPECTEKNTKQIMEKQEVVRLNVISDIQTQTPSFQAGTFEQPAFSNGSFHSSDTAVEICTGSSVIRISNNISPQLFGMVLSQLGGPR